MPAKELDQTHLQISIATLGDTSRGKDQLSEALDKVMATPKIQVRGWSWSRSRDKSAMFHEIHRHIRRYEHVDVSGRNYIKNLITGSSHVDAGIVVVSLDGRSGSQAHRQIELARQAGIPRLIVFLDLAEKPFDPELLQLVQKEVRHILIVNHFESEDTPIVIGSLEKALDGDGSEIGVPSVIKLIEEMDQYIPAPQRPIDKPFLMSVEDVRSLPNGTTVVSGRIEAGMVSANDEIEVVGFGPARRAICTGVEMFRQKQERGEAGDNVEILLKGLKRDEIQRGQILARPGSAQAYLNFECDVYVLTPDEGGQDAPLIDGSNLNFYFRTRDVPGTITVSEGLGKVMPGDNTKLTVALESPVALEEGLRFPLRQGGRTIGAGVVTTVLRAPPGSPAILTVAPVIDEARMISIPQSLADTAISEPTAINIALPVFEDLETQLSFFMEGQPDDLIARCKEEMPMETPDDRLVVVAVFPSGAIRTVGLATRNTDQTFALRPFNYWSLLDPDADDESEDASSPSRILAKLLVVEVSE